MPVFLLFTSFLYGADTIPRHSKISESAITAAVSLETLYLRGSIGEYVYSENIKKSQLTWLIQPAVYIGSTVHISFYNKITLGVGYWTAINRKTGNMTDTDWSDAGTQTRLSHHECIIQKADIIDTGITMNIADFSWANLFICLGYKWQNTAIEARDGYVEYTGDPTRLPIAGQFAQYEQRLSIPYAGISLYMNLPHGFHIIPFFFFSPLLNCKAEDIHISTGLNYYDTFKNGLYYYTGGAISYEISIVSLRIHYGYTCIPMIHGDTYTENKFSGTRTKTFRNAAGMQFHAFEIGCAIGTSMEW